MYLSTYGDFSFSLNNLEMKLAPIFVFVYNDVDRCACAKCHTYTYTVNGYVFCVMLLI